MSDWGGDYSMILHNVEDKLDDHLADENSASTRKRIRADSMSLIDDENSFNQSAISSSVLKLNVELDEAKIKNEELAEKLAEQRDDFKRQKDKYIRQLEFMENDNRELKVELESKKEKYYAVKKKLQATIRAADSEKQTLSQQILQLSQSKNASKTLSGAPEVSSVWEGRFSELETSVATKSEEAKRLRIRNAELEEKCAVLEHRLVAARAEVSAEDSQTSTRSLHKQISDLESLLRRRSREVEKLEHQLKNQHLLEQDLSSCNHKLSDLRASTKALHDIEGRYNVLMKEKESWSVYFQSIVGQVDGSEETGVDGGEEGSGTGGRKEVTPVLVLRLLSNVQSKCASLLRSQCEIDSKNGELRAQVRQMERRLKAEEERRTQAEELCEESKQSNTLLKQQVQLFEGEVMSLRALLKTFDAEVAILEGHNRSDRKAAKETPGGRPSEALDGVKGTVIEELRAEVDSLRKQRQVELQQIADAQAETKRAELSLRQLRAEVEADEEGAARRTEVRVLKAKCENLLVELLALQKATGLDFIPGSTKVLHAKLSSNPSLTRYGVDVSRWEAGEAGGAHASPMDELRHLRKEVRSLREGLGASSGSSSSASAAVSASGPVSMLDTSVSLNTTSVGGLDASKMNQRLKEMFKERINSYREAVYLLFGFKVDLYQADAASGIAFPQLKLRSMYAESPEDSLVFQMKGNTLELMETPFATSLDESLIRTLQASNAVPVFLANVLLDLYEKQTFMG